MEIYDYQEDKNVKIEFYVLDEYQKIEPGREHMKGYMISDVKMHFTCKATFVTNSYGSKYP